MDHIVVARQKQASSIIDDQIFAIYLESFPSYERPEFSALMQSIYSNERLLFTAMRGSDVIAFAIILPFIAHDVHLLEFLAVSPTARSSGIGGIVLREVTKVLGETDGISGILLEVEHDGDGDEEEQEIRKQRIAFYERNGAQLIEAVPNYRVPLIDRAGTMRMKLFWLKAQPHAEIPQGDRLRTCVVNTLAMDYGLTSESHLVQAAIADIE
jgi:ribosomal protein S18 acetylase RimI-like enzyme